MIDIENYIYTYVRSALLAEFANVDVSSEYTENPAVFPHVCIEMSDNTTHAESMTAQQREFAAEQTFTVNIYTVSQTRKSDAKKIAAVVDSSLSTLGFRRAMYLRTPNIDRNIYRLTMRYNGIVSVGYDGNENHFKITAR